MLDGDNTQLWLDNIQANLPSVADTTALTTVMDNYFATIKNDLYKDILVTYKSREVVPGNRVSSLTITAAGTGYLVGDEIVISGDGTGATAEVETVDGSGAITGIKVKTGGYGYTTATADLSGSGDGLATAVVVVDNQLKILNDLINSL